MGPAFSDSVSSQLHEVTEKDYALVAKCKWSCTDRQTNMSFRFSQTHESKFVAFPSQTDLPSVVKGISKNVCCERSVSNSCS